MAATGGRPASLPTGPMATRCPVLPMPDCGRHMLLSASQLLLLCGAAAMALLSLAAVLSLHFAGLPPGPSEDGAARPPRPLSVVVVAKEDSCVLQAVVQQLLQRLWPQPREVLLVMKGCGRFVAPAARVRCLDEDRVLEGISYAKVDAWFKQRFGQLDTEMLGGSGGHTQTGWFLQQLLKLACVAHAPELNLTEDVLIWDADVFLVNRFAVYDGAGRMGLMVDERHKQTYEHSVARLLGEPMAYSPDGYSFVTHHMLMNRDVVLEIFEVVRRRYPSHTWSDAIMEASCASVDDCTFSEYSLYSTWVLRHHPDKVVLAPKRGRRFPLLKQSCCPQHYSFAWVDRLLGLDFVNFEAGCFKEMRPMCRNVLLRPLSRDCPEA